MSTVASETMRYVTPFDEPRLLSLLHYIEERGGEVQVPLAELAADLKMPGQAVMRRARWAETYGLLEIVRTASGFGTGRSPNTYRLTMPIEQWLKEGEAIVAGVSARLYPGNKPAVPQAARPAVPDPRFDALRDEVRAQVAEELADLEPLDDSDELADDELGDWEVFS